MVPVSRSRQPSLVAVARLAGVSLGSASNAISQPHLVSAAMREKVQEAVDALGYVPNRAASALRRGSNPLLGLVIPDVTNPFYAAIVDAVVEAADRYGYAVSLCVSHDDPEREYRHFDLLAQQRAAGALVVPIEANLSRLSRLRGVGTRLILVDRSADARLGCSVAVDDVLGGRLAVDHLLGCEGEGVTIVNGSSSIPQCRDRLSGAREALVSRGLDPRSLHEIEVDEMDMANGVAAGERIAREGAPRRIFCINDQLARGVIDGLSSAGLSVPEDASVIGYGDLAISAGGSLALSTVGQPKREMGAAAVDLLLDELHDGDQHEHTATVFEPHLIARDSTRLRPADDRTA